MEDILPDISLKPDKPIDEFLLRLKEVAEALGSYVVEKHDLSGDGGGIVWSFIPKDGVPHEDLAGQILLSGNTSTVLSVEIRAIRWTPDPTTYETYVEAAHYIFDPLLKAYNQKYKQQKKLIIQAKADTEPKLPPKAFGLFRSFVTLANKKSPHPLDWDRFYLFIGFCHARRVQLNSEGLYRLLVKEGFEENKAREIAEVYHHGRALLAPRLISANFLEAQLS